MIVDHNGNGVFIVRIPRALSDSQNRRVIQDMMIHRGLDFSTSASSEKEAVLFTSDAWAVADLAAHATPAAMPLLRAQAERIAASRLAHSDSHYRVPPDCELWPFQKASLDYVLAGGRQNLIGDEPGLGKTPQAIVYANEIGARKVLVICPAAIRSQWARKIEQWSTMRRPFLVYPVFAASRGVHPHAEWVILSFALARNPDIVAALSRMRFDLLIVDESHNLKDIGSQQTRAVFGQADGMYHPQKAAPVPAISRSAEHILCLSGTPIVNRPLEAYTTARSLAWDSIDYMSLERFRERYNPQRETILGRGKRVREERIGRVTELGNRLRGTFMARHAKREVLTQLKYPRYEVIQYEETRELKRLIEAESMLDIDIDKLQSERDYSFLGHIASLRREMGVAAAPQAVDYVKGLLDGGLDKIVVFAWHIEVLDILQQGLSRYNVVRIDGSTPPARRQDHVDAFVKRKDVRVFLGNIQSIGTGVDGLQNVCSHCVIVEPSWRPGENQQAVDRLDRGGQTNTVQADFLVPPGSVIEKVLVSALSKASVIHHTLK